MTPTTTKPEPKKPQRIAGDSRLAEFWESIRGWRNGIFILLAAGVAFLASRVPVLRPMAAELFSMAFPIVAIVIGFWALRSATGWLRYAGVTVAALLVLGSEATLAEVWFPPEPLAAVTLSESHRTTTVNVPDSMDDFEVQARGKLASEHGAARGNFEVQLERGGESRAFMGEFSRVIGNERRMMRRMAPTRSVTETVIVREEMRLERRGPLHAKLVSIEGGVRHAVRLSIQPMPSTDRPLFFGLLGLTIAALVLEVAAARKSLRMPLTGGAAAAVVLALYVVREFDPDDPLTTFWGAAVVAVLAGAIGGVIIGKIAAFLFGGAPSAPPTGPSKPSRA